MFGSAYTRIKLIHFIFGLLLNGIITNSWPAITNFSFLIIELCAIIFVFLMIFFLCTCSLLFVVTLFNRGSACSSFWRCAILTQNQYVWNEVAALWGSLDWSIASSKYVLNNNIASHAAGIIIWFGALMFCETWAWRGATPIAPGPLRAGPLFLTPLVGQRNHRCCSKGSLELLGNNQKRGFRFYKILEYLW